MLSLTTIACSMWEVWHTHGWKINRDALLLVALAGFWQTSLALPPAPGSMTSSEGGRDFAAKQLKRRRSWNRPTAIGSSSANRSVFCLLGSEMPAKMPDYFYEQRVLLPAVAGSINLVSAILFRR